MAHHARYPRLVSAALPEALRRAIYDRHAKRIAARLQTAPGSRGWVEDICSLAHTDPELFPLYHNGRRRFPTVL
jgi:hypothetical protein